MTTLQGAFVTVGLGSINPKYMWNGKELQGIIKNFLVKKVDEPSSYKETVEKLNQVFTLKQAR